MQAATIAATIQDKPAETRKVGSPNGAPQILQYKYIAKPVSIEAHAAGLFILLKKIPPTVIAKNTEPNAP